MKIIENASLKRKLNGSFLIVFIFILVIGVVIYNAVLDIQELNELIDKESEAVHSIQKLRRDNLSLRYRTRRLYTSLKEKNLKRFSDQAISEVQDMYADLKEIDSLYEYVRPIEKEEVTNYITQKTDSVEMILSGILPALEGSLRPYTDYVRSYSELQDYLKNDSLNRYEIERIQDEMKSSQRQSRKIYDAGIFQTYGVINHLMDDLAERLIANVNSHQSNVENIISKTLIIVLTTTGLALVLILLISSFLNSMIIPPVNKVVRFLTEFAEGKFPDIELKEREDEIGKMAVEINKLRSNLEKSTEFAQSMGDGNFDMEFEAKDALGRSLLSMHQSLKSSQEEEKNRQFIAEGMSKLNSVLRKQTDNLEEFGDNLLHCIIKYLGIQVGGFYVVEQNGEGEAVLEMEACYAYDRKKFIQRTFKPGEGVVGQTYTEGEHIQLVEVPDYYMQIRSGLGDTPPGSIYATPLIHNDMTVGVLEFASIQPMTELQIQFIEEASEAIASDLSSQKTNNETKRLLDETQKRTLEMQAQEEELRQNMEELQATQENVVRSENRTKAILASIKDGIVTVDSDGIINTVNNATCRIFGYSENELMGEDVTKLMPSDYLIGQTKNLGQPQDIEVKNKNSQLFSVQLTVQEAFVGSEKVFVGMIREID